MTEVEQAILATLIELDGKVAAMKTAQPKPDLLPVFQRLDDLATRLPADTHGQLLHFLRNKSYEKARLWLEGREAEIGRGSCGR
jgi:hypothetical protein